MYRLKNAECAYSSQSEPQPSPEGSAPKSAARLQHGGERDAGRRLRELGGRAAAGALGALPDERGLLRAGDRLHRLLGVGDVVEEHFAGGGLLEGLRLLLELRVDEPPAPRPTAAPRRRAPWARSCSSWATESVFAPPQTPCGAGAFLGARVSAGNASLGFSGVL